MSLKILLVQSYKTYYGIETGQQGPCQAKGSPQYFWGTICHALLDQSGKWCSEEGIGQSAAKPEQVTDQVTNVLTY